MMPPDSLRPLLWTRYEIPPQGHPMHAPLQHVLAAPGSLARPRLALVSARRHNWIDGHALDLAAAMELFHTASLVLDDLPCMDDASDRRGVTCVHHVHGEAAALLATVYMINRAFLLLGRSLDPLPIDARIRAREAAAAELGANGILLGQALDLAARDGRETDIADLADLKTGSLLRLSLMVPVAAAGNLAEISLVNQLSRVWGEAYQLLDDIQDTGCDAAAGSPNRVADEGLAQALSRYDSLVVHSANLCDALVRHHTGWGPLAAFHAHFADAPRGQCQPKPSGPLANAS